MPTSNEQILDSLLRHQLGLLRYSASTARRIIKLLNDSERDLRDELERRLRFLAGRSLSGRDFTSERFTAMLAAVAEIRTEVHTRAHETLREEMLALLRNEATFAATTVELAVPVILEMARPSASQLNAIVMHNPFEGRTLSQWAADIRKADIDRIQRAIRIGLVQGESTQDIVRRVIGTQGLFGSNGATQMTRNQMTAIVRTAVNSYSNEARRLTFQVNADIINEELFVATIDSRTTLICASNDGKRFTVGEGPQPPLHFNCRSVRVALVTQDVIGERPFKPTTERQLLREFAEARNIPVARKRDDLPFGFKTDFDKFARRRTRELVGQVPARTTFEAWLKQQPAWFKKDYLGETRAALFERGKLSLSDLVNGDGRPFTLEQLATLDAGAFKRAGLDVEAFV